MNVIKAIEKRKSTREFSRRPVSLKDIETINRAAYKIPSAGNLRPIEVYFTHPDLQPICAIICADFNRTTVKYGDRGIAYVYMEAGHTAQNICLVCEELGLGSCCVGTFDVEKVKRAINTNLEPIYMVAIGYPK